jgi:hypothetical protein
MNESAKSAVKFPGQLSNLLKHVEFNKKLEKTGYAMRIAMIERDNKKLSLVWQCHLISITRTLIYSRRRPVNAINCSWIGLGRALDNVFMVRLWRTVNYLVYCSNVTFEQASKGCVGSLF